MLQLGTSCKHTTNLQATIGATSSVTSAFSAYFALAVGMIAVVVHALCPVIRLCRGETLPYSRVRLLVCHVMFEHIERAIVRHCT